MNISIIDNNGQIKPLAVIEKEAVRAVLKIANGNMSETARSLMVGRSTLYRKYPDLKPTAE